MALIFDYFKNIEFAYPQWLFLLLLIPILAGWYIQRFNKQQGALKVSHCKVSKTRPRLKVAFAIFHSFAYAGYRAAHSGLARPRSHNDEQFAEGEGIDIVLALTLVEACCMKILPNRLEAAKQVAMEFVDNRPTDRIRLVVFPVKVLPNAPSPPIMVY
jgi:Ca-activated chloride channel family protein